MSDGVMTPGPVDGTQRSRRAGAAALAVLLTCTLAACGSSKNALSPSTSLAPSASSTGPAAASASVPHAVPASSAPVTPAASGSASPAGASATTPASATTAATTTTTAPASKRFVVPVKDPKLVWKQPAGLTGADAAVVDTLHAYYVRYMVFGHTLSVKKSGVLSHMAPLLVSGESQLLGEFKHPLTGTLAVTVQSAAVQDNDATVEACFDQTDFYQEDAKGKPVILHSANDHLHEEWSLLKTKGSWEMVDDARHQGC